jgi:hypothetical protein
MEFLFFRFLHQHWALLLFCLFLTSLSKHQLSSSLGQPSSQSERIPRALYPLPEIFHINSTHLFRSEANYVAENPKQVLHSRKFHSERRTDISKRRTKSSDEQLRVVSFSLSQAKSVELLALARYG